MPPLKVIVLGGGTAGWMAANLMADRWRDRVRVTVIQSPDIGIIGVGEGSTPTLNRFFSILNIAENEWMPHCHATYKVGIRFDDWSPASGVQSYRHPFISQPDVFTERAFHVNCQTRRLGLDVNTDPGQFLLNGALADQGKAPLCSENFPFKMEYGYHFDSALLGKFLTEHAQGLGVEPVNAEIREVQLKENGDIACLIAADGSRYGADIFIDCTGFHSLLIEKTLRVPFKSFKDNLFNDSAVVMSTPAPPELPVETVSCALSNGWMWRIPLTSRYGNGYVYSSDFIDADAAETELRTRLGLLNDSREARHLKMRVGQREKHWHRNCLALGLSQGFIEPLEATALHLVQISILEFMHLFEEGDFTSKHRNKFNNFITTRFERVRDYIVAHYKLNTRKDSDYWRTNRKNRMISDSLSQLLDVWYQRGDLGQEIQRQKIGDHFNITSWHCLLAGYGDFPPLAPNQPGRGDLYKENEIGQFLRGCSLNFQSHQRALNAMCKDLDHSNKICM